MCHVQIRFPFRKRAPGCGSSRRITGCRTCHPGTGEPVVRTCRSRPRRETHDFVLPRILARRIAGHPRFHCTHADGSSLVELNDELGELGVFDHNPWLHTPPRPASISTPNHPGKPPDQGSVIIVAGHPTGAPAPIFFPLYYRSYSGKSLLPKTAPTRQTPCPRLGLWSMNRFQNLFFSHSYPLSP